jgi:hypothetical protein
MKNLIIPILAVLAMLQSCSQAYNKLVADETAKTVFNPSELTGIEKTISFVDSIILDNKNATDINQGYHNYFDKLKTYISEGKMYPVLVKDTVKFKFLESLDEEAFAAIWRMDDHVRKVKYKDTILTDLHVFKSLELNYKGKYMIYLKEIGKSDSLYNFIFISIQAAGDIPPTIVGWFPTHHQELDFNLFKDRLWATVFLLRLGDPLEERVERYLKEKNSGF